MFKRVKPLVDPILIPSKIGLKAAKYGFRLAKKPIENTLFKESEKVVTEITADNFKKMMVNSARKIVIHQEEINRINVFPVADKDTGYNLAATLLGTEGVISQKEYLSFRELAKDIKEGAMVNARGNAGMILTGYLIRLLNEIKAFDSLDSQNLSLAMKKGVRAAYSSIAHPVEGTILDVIKTAGETAYNKAKKEKETNIITVLQEAKKNAEVSLAATKEKLPVLKENNVVDAGALGFVKILEAWIDSLKGHNLPQEGVVNFVPVEVEGKTKANGQYELVFRVEKGRDKLKDLKGKLINLGDSLDLIESVNQVKVHIHTHYPAKIRAKIKNLKILDWRIEELFPGSVENKKKKPLGLAVGQTASLPKEYLQKYQIEEIPFTAKFPNGEFLSRDNIFSKMREAEKNNRPLPISSTPSFNDFLVAYRKALPKFEKILVITLSSRLSGTYSQARVARSLLESAEKERVIVFDCFTVDAGEALTATYAQELISQGKNLDRILKSLKDLCPKVRFFAGIDNYKYIVAGGRYKLPNFLLPLLSLLTKMGIWLVIQTKDGKLKPLGIKFGKKLEEVMAKEVIKAAGKGKIQVVVAHADNEKGVEALKKLLRNRPNTEILYTSSVCAPIGVHTGPGALIVAFHPV